MAGFFNKLKASGAVSLGAPPTRARSIRAKVEEQPMLSAVSLADRREDCARGREKRESSSAGH